MYISNIDGTLLKRVIYDKANKNINSQVDNLKNSDIGYIVRQLDPKEILQGMVLRQKSILDLLYEQIPIDVANMNITDIMDWLENKLIVDTFNPIIFENLYNIMIIIDRLINNLKTYRTGFFGELLNNYSIQILLDYFTCNLSIEEYVEIKYIGSHSIESIYLLEVNMFYQKLGFIQNLTISEKIKSLLKLKIEISEKLVELACSIGISYHFWIDFEHNKSDLVDDADSSTNDGDVDMKDKSLIVNCENECVICYTHKETFVECIQCNSKICDKCCNELKKSSNILNSGTQYKCPLCRKIQYSNTHVKKMFSHLNKKDINEITNFYKKIKPCDEYIRGFLTSQGIFNGY